MILTKEEMLDIIDYNCTTEPEVALDYIKLGAEAGIKKVLEYLDKRSISFQPEGESAVWIISCDKKALLEEGKR